MHDTELKTIDTGGGCRGLYLEHPLGRAKAGYFLITNLEGDDVPVVGEKAILGWYTHDSDFIQSLDIVY